MAKAKPLIQAILNKQQTDVFFLIIIIVTQMCVRMFCLCERKKNRKRYFCNVHVCRREKSRFVCCFRIILSFTRIWFPFFLFPSFHLFAMVHIS